MALQGFDKEYYLGQKLAALQAAASEWSSKTVDDLEATLNNVFGLTAEEHYQQYGWAEGIGPNQYFNAEEYKLAKAQQLFDQNLYLSVEDAVKAFEDAWDQDPYQHYLQYGAGESINPSNAFDASQYFADKLADLQADSETADDWAGKTAEDVKDAFLDAGLTAIEHFMLYGEDEGLTITEVPADEQVDPGVTTPTEGKIFTLTTGVDEFVGGAGNDTFNAYIDGTDDTLTALDSIDGGAGTDKLRINDINDLAPATDLSSIAFTVENVEVVEVRSSTDFTADTSDWRGVTNLNVLQGKVVDLTAAADTAVNVTGIAAGVYSDDGDTANDAPSIVTVDGGSTQTVSVDKAGIAVSLSGAAGAVSVTNTRQESLGKGDGDDTPSLADITINDGTDITVDASMANTTATAKVAGDITIGTTDEASGTVTVTQALTSDGQAAVTSGDITVDGGTSIDITSSITVNAKSQTASSAHTFGAVDVDSDGNTTEVSVTQAYAETEFTKAAVSAVKEKDTVTFKAMTSGETLTASEGGKTLTFTASQDLEAADVAAAFANLINNDAQSAGGVVENGVFSGNFSTNWTTGAASGATVVFTADSASETNITWGGSADAPTVVNTPGTAGSASSKSANTITYGTVAIDEDATEDASIETITLNGYGVAALGGGQSLDALTALSLANSDGAVTLTTAQTALDLTVDTVEDAVSLDGGAASIADLTINAVGDDSEFALTAANVENLTIAATADLDISGSTIGSGNSLATVEISGAGAVDLGTVQTSTSLDSFDASANTGGVTATVDADAADVGDIEEYIFSAGDDDVTLNDDTVSVDVQLGDGDDVLTLNSFANAASNTTLTATLDGGAGSNTLALGALDAENRSQGTDFQAKFENFDKLSIGYADADRTVKVNNLDNINYVITNGTAVATNAVYTIDLTGIVLDATDTFSIAGTLVHTAAGAGEDLDDVAAGIDSGTVAFGGVTYDIDATDPTAVTLTAQTAANTVAGIALTVVDVSTNGNATAPTVNAGITPTTEGIAAGSETTLTLQDLADAGTVELNGGSKVVVDVKDADTNDDASVSIIANAAQGTLQINEVETINIETAEGASSFALTADSVESLFITGDKDLDLTDGSGVSTITNTNDTLTLIDASALEGDLTAATNGVVAQEIIAGEGDDTLYGTGENDVLRGGDGDDVLYASDLTQLYGGAGDDTFYFDINSNLTKVSTIHDVNSGDTIVLYDHTGSAVVDKFYAAGAQYNPNTTTDVAGKVNAALVQTAGGEASWFNHGDYTYIVIDGATGGGPAAGAVDTYSQGDDIVIEIVGVFDLSTDATFNSDYGTLEFA